jgi:putative redox protein
MREVRVDTAAGKFGQKVRIGPHEIPADEPREEGGDDTGPEPHELLLAALGVCSSMTVKLYADRKGWPLRSVEVRLTGQRGEAEYRIERSLRLQGDLTDEQKARLVEIADKCPVARTLKGTIAIETRLASTVAA